MATKTKKTKETGTSLQRRKAKLVEVGELGEAFLSRIRPYKRQPRKEFDEEELKILAFSIGENTQDIPIHVTLLPEDRDFDYRLVSGERRFRACKILTKEFPSKNTIKIIVLPQMDEKNTFLKSVTENCCRQDLCFLDEIGAVEKMSQHFPEKSQEELAKDFGKNQVWISDRLIIANNLHPDVRKLLDPKLPKGEQLAITTTTFLAKNIVKEEQLYLAKKVVEEKLSANKAIRFIFEEADMAGHTIKIKRRKLKPNDTHRVMRDFLLRTSERFKDGLHRSISVEDLFEHRNLEDLNEAVFLLGQIIREATRHQDIFKEVQIAMQNGSNKKVAVSV